MKQYKVNIGKGIHLFGHYSNFSTFFFDGFPNTRTIKYLLFSTIFTEQNNHSHRLEKISCLLKIIQYCFQKWYFDFASATGNWLYVCFKAGYRNNYIGNPLILTYFPYSLISMHLTRIWRWQSIRFWFGILMTFSKSHLDMSQFALYAANLG